jgi:hypothetical protein
MKRLIRYFIKNFCGLGNQGRYPAGHFHSPIPDKGEITAYINYRKTKDIILPDIKLNKEDQFKLLQEYSQFYGELSFPENQRKRMQILL